VLQDLRASAAEYRAEAERRLRSGDKGLKRSAEELKQIAREFEERLSAGARAETKTKD
jgi:hypothetical protein